MTACVFTTMTMAVSYFWKCSFLPQLTVTDVQRTHTQQTPPTSNGSVVKKVSSIKFLGVHITKDLSWTDNTTSLASGASTTSAN